MNGLLESRMRRKFASPVRRRAVGKGLSDTRQNLAGRPTYPEEDRDKFDALAKTLQEQLSGVKNPCAADVRR